MASRICLGVLSFSKNPHNVNFCRGSFVLFQRNSSQAVAHNDCSPGVKDLVELPKSESFQSNTDEEIQEKIFKAALPFVNTHGWSKSAITAGAEAVGYPGIVHGMFPRGGANLVEYFYSTCNRELALKMKLETEGAAAENKKKDPQVFVAEAIEARLRMIIPYLPKWPQALAIMALPPNAPHSIQNLMMLADDICYYSGDRSVDVTWYAKRLGVGSIYKVTELYFLQDTSPDYQNTWHFLNRRIEDAVQLHTVLMKSESASTLAKDVANVTFTTVRNMLGLNWNR
ncbi:ubiquinone biosynthesis protein COQ9, mitochondrial isoform X1 [Bemisia tabaci]|nr:PREDICTED: ubiquinone biosynthesis protein COQ9, mitochondrial isoform X1 [Bemisia tabaci]